MQMKASTPNEGCRAIVKGMEIYGVGLGVGKERNYTILGWDRSRLLTVVDENTSVRLEWPDSDFFKVRVGSDPPFLDKEKQKTKDKQKPKEEKEEK